MQNTANRQGTFILNEGIVFDSGNLHKIFHFWD